MKTLISLILTALMLGAASLPAQAQSKKEMVAKDIELEQRLTDLEGRMLTGDPAAERLMQRMDTLETAQRALTGEIEQLRYERDSLRKDVESLVGDIAALQTQIADIQRAPAVIAAPAPQGPIVYEQADPYQAAPDNQLPPVSVPYQEPAQGTLGSAPIDASQLQIIGQEKLRAGDFTGAQLAFKQYIEVSPDAADVGDAYFWLGETYFVKSGFEKAAESYIASMRAAPEGALAPSAMIGLAGALRGMGNTDGACQTLDGFPIQFPNAPPDMRQKAERERQRSGCQ